MGQASVNLKYSFEQIGETGILTLGGRLAGSDTGDLGAALGLALNNAHWIVVNLELVTEVDAAGLSLICRSIGDSTRARKILLLTSGYLDALQRRIGHGELACPATCLLDERDCVFQARQTAIPGNRGH